MICFISYTYMVLKGLDLSCQAPVVGLPPFPAPMKKPPFVVKERFFSRLAVHYFVFLYVSLCTLLQAFSHMHPFPAIHNFFCHQFTYKKKKYC